MMKVNAFYNVLQKQIGVILNSIRHGVLITDRRGQIMIANNAATKILRKPGIESVLGQHLTTLNFCPEIEKAVFGAATGLTFYKQQCLVDLGTYLNWDVSPLRDNNGKIAGAILLFEDVTETVSLTRQLREWERLAAAGEVAAGLAHEIRNPLAAAMGSLQLLNLANTDDQRQDLLARFSGELDRMNCILTDYLNLSNPLGEEELGPVNLPVILGEIHLLIHSEAVLSNVELEVKTFKDGPLWVAGNGNDLKKVFVNIAKNALEAMADGGCLTISLNGNKTHAWIEFQDNGTGIPLEHQDNVFRPFFTTKIGGTGLGLAISSRMIEHMGGEIAIASVPGNGTNVKVVLPVLQEIEEVKINKNV